MIKLENVGKIYSTNNNVAVGIRKVNLEFNLGEFVAITGESGSGKSTLLNVISGIDSYDEGEMYIDGQETSFFSVEDIEKYRNKYVGFVFQNYNIVDSYTVLQNVEAALLFLNIEKKERREKAIDLIKKVGLYDKLNAKASKLSGGEKQRVVIARALAKDPPIIAADEPTGNLDSKTSKEIIELLHVISENKLVLIVTHDFEEVEDYATRLIRVYDGEIKEDRVLKNFNSSSIASNNLNINTEKIKIKDMIEFSLKDLLSSPKRMIFYFIVIFILCIFSLLSIGIYRSNYQSYFYSSSRIYNTDKRRIMINKEDGEPFSEAEINELLEINNVDFIIESDLLLDSTYWIDISTSDYYTYLNLYPMSIKYLAENIKCGRLPENDNEVVVTVSSADFTKDCSDYEDFLNYDFYFYDYDSNFKIVGVVDGNKIESGVEKYIYFTDALFNELRLDNLISNLTYDYSVKNEDYNYKNSMWVEKIKEDSSLNDNEIGTTYYLEANIHIQAYDIYGEYLDIENASNKLIEEKNDDNYYNTLFLSTNNYNLFINNLNKTYQLSIFLKNGSKINQEYIKKILDQNNYNYIIPSVDSTESNPFSIIIMGASLMTTGIFLFITLLIVYLILSISIKSRKDDVEILRTIGAKEKDIKKMFTLEFSFLGLVSYILLIIIFILLRLFASGEFLSTIKSITFIDFIILLIIIICLNIILSFMFSRKMFKKTIKKTLDQR